MPSLFQVREKQGPKLYYRQAMFGENTAFTNGKIHFQQLSYVKHVAAEEYMCTDPDSQKSSKEFPVSSLAAVFLNCILRILSTEQAYKVYF